MKLSRKHLVLIKKENMYKTFLQWNCRRTFSTSRIRPNSSELKSAESKPKLTVQEEFAGLNNVVPSDIDRRILVYCGRYKSLSDIPKTVSSETLNKVRSQMRIKVANYLMAFILLCCFLVSYWGKKRAQRGESLVAILNERDKKIVEDYKHQMAAQEALKESK